MPEITCLYLHCPHCRARVVVFVERSCITIREQHCVCEWTTQDLDNLRQLVRSKAPDEIRLARMMSDLQQELLAKGVDLS